MSDFCSSNDRQLELANTNRNEIRTADTRVRDAALDAWERVMSPGSENTTRAYRQAFAQWCVFAESLGLAPLPIEPATLITYLELLGQTSAPNTVRQALSALSSVDVLARITPSDPSPTPLRQTASIKRWLRNWSREHPRAPRKRAAVLRVRDIEAVLQAAQEPRRRQARGAHVLRYARDRALLLIGITSGCRVSELAALDVADVERTPRGLTLHIRRSKTDQEGRGMPVAVLPQGRPLLCPVDAWIAWLAVRSTALPPDGPAFVAIDRQGHVLSDRLTVRSIQRAIQDRCRAAGIKAASSHSMRRSMATIATERGKSILSVKRQGRWRSIASVEHYVDEGSLYRANASAGLLDDDAAPDP